jgi:hypothetical protein
MSEASPTGGKSPAGGRFLAQISEGAHATRGAVSHMAEWVCPTCARTKKRSRGRPGIGARFWSFNFTNSLICGFVSSAEPTSRSSDARSLRQLASYLRSGPKNATASASARRRNSAMSSLSLAGLFANFPQPEKIRSLSFEFGLHEGVSICVSSRLDSP